MYKRQILFSDWVKRRPYRAPPGRAYIPYRREQFTSFFNTALSRLNPRILQKLNMDLQAAALTIQRAAYLRQMTINAALTPTEYCDVRQPIPREALSIGVISNGRYYLIDALADGAPLPFSTARRYAHAVLGDKPTTGVAEIDKLLVNTHRHDQPKLRQMIPAGVRAVSYTHLTLPTNREV